MQQMRHTQRDSVILKALPVILHCAAHTPLSGAHTICQMRGEHGTLTAPLGSAFCRYILFYGDDQARSPLSRQRWSTLQLSYLRQHCHTGYEEPCAEHRWMGAPRRRGGVRQKQRRGGQLVQKSGIIA